METTLLFACLSPIQLGKIFVPVGGRKLFFFKPTSHSKTPVTCYYARLSLVMLQYNHLNGCPF